MLFKIVTDYVRPIFSANRPEGVSIFDIDGVFVITSRIYSILCYDPTEVIAYMSMVCQLYCGRIITATFINDGVTSYGNR